MRRSRHTEGRLYQRKNPRTGTRLATWTMVFTVRGTERRESTGTTDYKTARAILAKRVGELAAGTYLAPDRGTVTVNDLITRLLDYYDVKGHRSRPSATSQAKAVREALGSCRALDLTTGEVLKVIKGWQAHPTANGTINRRLALLRRAYSLGKIAPDPARLDFPELFLLEKGRLGQHINAAAFTAIMEQLPASVRPIFEFCYLTGQRKGQVSRTTWAHWNAHTREFTWSAAEVKAKHAYVLPLDGRPLALIEGLYATRRLFCPFVFHAPTCAPGRVPSRLYGCVGYLETTWASACKRAGFPVGRKHGGFTFHNTRHTAVTNLVNAGVPTHEAMAVSGHRTRSVFDRYSLALKDQTRSAMRQVTRYTAAQDTTPTVIPEQRAVQRRRGRRS
jgi:integrase